MLRLDADDGDERPDDAFGALIERGSGALAAGDLSAARDALERAVALRPKDAQALGLLGQACYRQGAFDDAAAAWQRLVDDNPVEPSPRVNLGLALLKARRHPEARRQLEIAVDLEPEHRRAMNYLGLALLESGSPVDAREWFRKAGSEQMVARCDEAIAGGVIRAVELPPPEGDVGGAGPPPVTGGAGRGAIGAEPVEALPQTPAARAPSLRAWAATRRVEGARGEPFSVGDDVVAVTVRGEVRARLEGLFAVRGRVALAGELKRFRGRATDQPFGAGASRVHRASGQGELLLHAAGRRFTPIALADEAAFLREEAAFAFEGALEFENGRVPAPAGAGLDLVHLRGRGTLLVRTRGEPVTLEASPGAPLRVPLGAVVGWSGALTPRIVALAEGAGEAVLPVVELTGEGWALADPAATEGAP